MARTVRAASPLSATDLLDRAMRIPGALAASIGELGGRTSQGVTRCADGSVATTPDYSRAAMDACAGSSRLAGGDQVLEELVLTGVQSYFVLRVVPLDSGAGPAFLHMALDRSQSNLALACRDIKALGECIGPAVERQSLDALTTVSRDEQPPGQALPRRESRRRPPTVEPQATPTDVSLLHRVVAALRRLE